MKESYEEQIQAESQLQGTQHHQESDQDGNHQDRRNTEELFQEQKVRN